MKHNPTWKDWFVFSKKERTIIVSLVVLMAGYLSFLIFYQPKTEMPVAENLDEKIAQLSSETSDSNRFQAMSTGSQTVSYISSNTGLHPFYFDPNTLDETGFAKLGLREKTVHTIINYRSKGGHFYKPDDLRKIYGLKEEEANVLVPYVKINFSQNEMAGNYSNNFTTTYHKAKPQVIDINTASAEQWESLPAIGEVLSNRIVKYRDKTGGFTAVGDIKKVYGISDSAYNAILPYLSFSGNKGNQKKTVSVQSSTQKININKATAAELKSNSNIPPDVADAIVIYRKQHGNYTSVEGIKKIVFINEDMYQKISPWLTVE